MRTLDLEQNSPIWEEYRRTHIGASDSPTICGVNPYKTAYKLWREKAVGEKQTLNHSMKEGHRLESSARDLAQKEWDMEFTPLCVLHDSIPYLMASLDGYNKDHRRSLEVKTVGNNTYKKVMESGPLPMWIYQVNHQMECTGLDSSYLLVMNRDSGCYSPFHITRDEKIVREIIEKDEEFYQRIINFEAPEDSHQERYDTPWKMAAESFLKAKEEANRAEEHLKACRDHLIDLSADSSCRGFGVSTTKYTARGTIDYSKIPELKSVDITQYRRAPKESWRIS